VADVRAVVATHHPISGGVLDNICASLAGKGGIDIVNAFMGFVAKREAGRARDAVPSIRDEKLGGGMATSTYIEEARGGKAVGGGTEGAKEGKKAKIIAAMVNKGSRIDDIGVEPKGASEDAGLLRARSDEVSMAGSRKVQVI
jgi:hypothetical protein